MKGEVFVRGECSGEELPARPVRLQTSTGPCAATRNRTRDSETAATEGMSDRRPAELSTSGSSDNCMIPPTENQRQRADRIASYKEARRKQLATQFASLSDSPAATATTKRYITRSPVTPRPNEDAETPPAVRTTRTSRLRAATADDGTTPSPVSSPRKSSVPRLAVRSKEEGAQKKTSSSPQRKLSLSEAHHRKVAARSDSPQKKNSNPDSPQRKTSHSDTPQRKTPLSHSPQRKNSQSDSSQRKTSHSDSSQRKNSLSDSSQRKNSLSDSSQRKNSFSDSSQRKNSFSDSSQIKTSHSDTSPKKTSHSDSSQRKTSHSDSSQKKTSHSDSSQRKNSLSDSSQRKTSHSESPQRKASSHSNSPQRKLSHSDSTQRKLSNADSSPRKKSHSDSPQRKPSHSRSPQRKASESPQRRPSHSDSSQRKSSNADSSRRKQSHSDSPLRKLSLSDSSQKKLSHSDASPRKQSLPDSSSRKTPTPADSTTQRKVSSSSRVSPARSTESVGSTGSLKRGTRQASPRVATPRTNGTAKETTRSSSRGRDDTTPASRRRSETPTTRRGSDTTPTTRRRSETPTTRRGSDTPTTRRGSETPTTRRGSETPTTRRGSNDAGVRRTATPTARSAASDKERSPMSSGGSSASLRPARPEKDKSAKRKSNLNRALSTEEVEGTGQHADDSAIRRRPRRLEPTSSLARRSPDHVDPVTSVNERVDLLTAITRQTVERLEKLTTMRYPLPLEEVGPGDFPVTESCEVFKPSRPSSILKKPSLDEARPDEPSPPPVSILKRKTSHEEASAGQSILKKRCSLDESEVLRRRSCSPDVSESRPILKRRSSLEELVRRAQSPDPQSILKRRPSRDDDLDERSSSPEPHGILKRKMATATPPTSHVSIAASVMLSLAGVDPAELEADHVRPILKKKSSSEDYTTADSSSDTPRPILKKKVSVDSDDLEDRPKKTILKTSRKSSQEDGREVESPVRFLGSVRDRESPKRLDMADKEGLYLKPSSPKLHPALNADCEIKPILKNSLERSSKERSLSFSEGRRGRASDNESTSSMDNELQTIFNRRRSPESSPIPPDEGMGEPRPLSVAERIQNMEHFLLQENGRVSPPGALPRRLTPLRSRDRARFSTQPVTLTDFNGIAVPDDLELAGSKSAQALTEDALPQQRTKQQQQPETRVVSPKAPMLKQMQAQMKAMAEEAQARRGARHRDDDRFQTQPVTSEEIQQAALMTDASTGAVTPPDAAVAAATTDEPDPSKLSLAERVRLFNQKSLEGAAPATPLRRRGSRFRTQPVTSLEVDSAQHRLSPLAATLVRPPHPEILGTLSARAAKEKMFEHAQQSLKSILKPGMGVATSELRSVLKKDASVEDRPRSILKQTSSDQRSSTSDEESDTGAGGRRDDLASVLQDVAQGDARAKTLAEVLRTCEDVSSSADTGTSDGESSGGREVKRIIRNDAVARRRQVALNKHKDRSLLALSKSQSHSAVSHRSVSQEVSRAEDEPGSTPGEVPLPLRRSATQPMEEAHEETVRSNASIAERLAALQKSGNTNWQKRLPKLKAEDDLTVVSINNLLNVAADGGGLDTLVSDRRVRLETATQGWKKRVEPCDAVHFSVKGRMEKESKTEIAVSPLASPTGRQKRTPRANRFRSKTARADEVKSMPNSPQKEPRDALSFKRSVSAPGGDEENGLDDGVTRVCVPRFNDETYTTFFQSVTESVSTDHLTEIRDEDLDHLGTQSSQLLIQRRTVKKATRKAASRNPVKTLAARTDLQEEYIEIKTGVAEKELKKMKVEQLAKQSNLAVEALAGLASTEDFTAVSLKKAGSPYGSAMLPFKELMLLHIKGRRHVQTRLVEPCAASINSGDNYVLVTPTEVYNWIGLYSNVIERSRGAEIASLIQQRKDLGCNTNSVITITEGKVTCPKSKVDAFWKHLNGTPGEVQGAGHPDEDELYESSIIDTNMVYEVLNQELVPMEEYWGAIPKIEMLDPSKVLAFDFGSELYVWSGKNASMDVRKVGLSLANELWEEGYDYSECDICPLTAAGQLGLRDEIVSAKDGQRPTWALRAKVNQHMETVLFREKFLDWPDFSRVIQAKGGDENEKQVEGSIEVKPCNAKEMFETRLPEPDLELEGSHVGRGARYVDEETSRHFEITTQSVTVWHILEYDSTQVPTRSQGQFHAGDSYVVRWLYTITITGRELNGQPSRHSMVGRDRCAYFCWQGSDASLNEQGAAALLTVELDHERGPQVRAVQGSEPPAFLNLFQGGMVVHAGRRNEARKGCWRLYMCRGELENETVLVEVARSVRQLRSRASLVLLNTTTGVLFIWHGSKTQVHTRKVAKSAAEKIKLGHPEEMGLEVNTKITIKEIHEGGEMNDFLEGLGGGKGQLYHSLSNQSTPENHTPRLFHLSSCSGSFAATEIATPYRTDKVTVAFPFLQSDLYSANQPTLFLLDNGSELWLWQGWWPEREDAGESGVDATGSGSVRWQAERRAAMQTAMDYWRLSRKGKPNAFLVWAGLEPLTFTNLFPMWTDRDDVTELNIRDGRKPGEVLMVESELARLTRSTYPPAQLLQRPLPDGVDPTRLEIYLDPQHFQELLGTTKEEFDELPTWKQTKMKKEAGLF